MDRDNRLDNININNNLQNLPNYRIWSDGQTIQVPRGNSTTLEFSKEQVQVNTSCFGEIEKGIFYPPKVRFYNTFNNLNFDQFNLSTNRDIFIPNWKFAQSIITIEIDVNNLTFNIEFEKLLTHGVNRFAVIHELNYLNKLTFNVEIILNDEGEYIYNINCFEYLYKNTVYNYETLENNLVLEVNNVTI
jgi:hypothetical protein